MAFYKSKDLKELYKQSKMEAQQWREDYHAYERLADNGLMEGMDTNLPEVNDGSLAAALFKLPKRVVTNDLSGTVKSLDRDEAWLSDLANMIWQNEIIPNANMQAPFLRKWKDAVRKAAIYGSVPIINLFVTKDGKDTSDFLIAQPQDVTLEPGKVSDYDSDVIFWDVYYTKLQLENMIEEAEEEQKEKKDSDDDSYNKWDVEAMRKILEGDFKEERDPMDTPRQELNKNVRPKGFKFCIVFQRGVEAPFYMYHRETNSTIREWSNPDPTGDIPVHFLYCYQDFINPYGIGIVKLAGGTQNVLDYMRQADVLATQLGLRPPIMIKGVADDVDIDSMVYAQDALWFTGQADVERQDLGNGIYSELPGRMQMYQSSLQKLIPTGDTSSSAANSGDPTQSKTPAGVKLAAANLSIDDEDFKDNLYITYAAVAKSMINTQFANMEGVDFLKLSEDEREILIKGGLNFEQDPETGEMSNQLEVIWDTVRSTFDFEVDPEQDKAKDDADKLEGLTRVAELAASDPTFVQDLASAGKKFNKGELMSEIIQLTSDNDKIITDISPEEAQAEEEGGQADPNAPQQKSIAESIRWTPQDLTPTERAQALEQGGIQPDPEGVTPNEVDQVQQMAGAAQDPNAIPEEQPQLSEEEMQANVEAVMQEFGVDEQTALTALAAEHAGFPAEDVIAQLQQYSEVAQ